MRGRIYLDTGHGTRAATADGCTRRGSEELHSCGRSAQRVHRMRVVPHNKQAAFASRPTLAAVALREWGNGSPSTWKRGTDCFGSSPRENALPEVGGWAVSVNRVDAPRKAYAALAGYSPGRTPAVPASPRNVALLFVDFLRRGRRALDAAGKPCPYYDTRYKADGHIAVGSRSESKFAAYGAAAGKVASVQGRALAPVSRNSNRTGPLSIRGPVSAARRHRRWADNGGSG